MLILKSGFCPHTKTGLTILSRPLECLEGGVETLGSPGDNPRLLANNSGETMFSFKGALVPVTLGGLHPLGKTALYEGDAYVIQYAVRCHHPISNSIMMMEMLMASSTQ